MTYSELSQMETGSAAPISHASPPSYAPSQDPKRLSPLMRVMLWLLVAIVTVMLVDYAFTRYNVIAALVDLIEWAKDYETKRWEDAFQLAKESLDKGVPVTIDGLIMNGTATGTTIKMIKDVA